MFSSPSDVRKWQLFIGFKMCVTKLHGHEHQKQENTLAEQQTTAHCCSGKESVLQNASTCTLIGHNFSSDQVLIGFSRR